MSTRIERAKKYYKKNGFAKTVKKTGRFLKNQLMQKRVWKYYLASEEELQEWSKVSFEKQPKLSILIPMYNTPLTFFKELMECIQGQIYENWELCLADGSGRDTEAYEYVRELQKTDARIKYKRLESNGGISENTNAALDMATGEFIVLCDHDDLITKDAFYHVVKAINEDELIDTLYTDEDKVDMKGKKYFEPSFKPDYNLDFLRSGNYICHMFVTRREIAQKVRFVKEYDGAQDFDFIFRCCEASRRVYHIPRLLYHWRCHLNSTAGNPESKLYAYEAGTKALQANLERCGIDAVAEMSQFWGYYVTNYNLVENPKVSLISTKELSTEVVDRITYDNLETVLINGEYSPANVNRIVRERATGEILFFVDPRVKKLEQECFERLLAPLQRDDLASTFGKVSNMQQVIYSAGMILGVRDSVGRSFPAVEYDNNGYAMRLFVTQNMSASDLTCAMIKREEFDKVQGMDEGMSYILSAIDLYLKMGTCEKLHMFEPRAKALIDAKVEEGEEWIDFGGIKTSEMEVFQKKWSDELSRIDKNYNPNFTKAYAGYVVKTWSEIKKENR